MISTWGKWPSEDWCDVSRQRSGVAASAEFLSWLDFVGVAASPSLRRAVDRWLVDENQRNWGVPVGVQLADILSNDALGEWTERDVPSMSPFPLNRYPMGEPLGKMIAGVSDVEVADALTKLPSEWAPYVIVAVERSADDVSLRFHGIDDWFPRDSDCDAIFVGSLALSPWLPQTPSRSAAIDQLFRGGLIRMTSDFGYVDRFDLEIYVEFIGPVLKLGSDQHEDYSEYGSIYEIITGLGVSSRR